MVEDEISKPFAVLLIFLSMFGFTKYARLKTKFNHVFLCYYSEDFNRWMAIDIVPNGVIPMILEEPLKRSNYLKVIKPNFDLWEGVKKTSKHFGKKYDYNGLFGAVWSIAKFIFTGIYNTDVANSPKKFVCSEYVVTAISASDVHLGNPMAIYPNLLSELTDEDNRFTTIIEKRNLKTNDLEGSKWN